jgi:hypothetical protein
MVRKGENTLKGTVVLYFNPRFQCPNGLKTRTAAETMEFIGNYNTNAIFSK